MGGATTKHSSNPVPVPPQLQPTYWIWTLINYSYSAQEYTYYCAPTEVVSVARVRRTYLHAVYILHHFIIILLCFHNSSLTGTAAG